MALLPGKARPLYKFAGVALGVAAIGLPVRPAHALDLCFTGSGNVGFQTNGHAKVENGALVVTPDALTQAGSLFSTSTFSTSGDLRAFFTVNISTTTGHGADGVAFVMQSNPMGASFIGAAGYGIGYGEKPNQVVVEFDTWLNDFDINDNHVGLTFDGQMNNHVAVATPPFILRTNRFNVWIDYTAATHQLDVYLSLDAVKPATTTLSYTVDLPARLGSNFRAGFTGSTGGSRSLHEIPFFVMTDGSIVDTDGDGVFDQCDADLDNDCTPNESDPQPANPSIPSSPCSGTTPVCAVLTAQPGVGTCSGCNGDFGFGATRGCSDEAAPVCFSDGRCDGCTKDSECAGHPGGAFCSPTTGACVSSCSSDSQCSSSAWCGDLGICEPKLADGEAVPEGCTPENAARYCASGTCDTRDDGCGIRPDYALSVVKGGSGSGSLVSSPEGIACDAACSEQGALFMVDTVVSLSAVAAPGSVFTGWTGACSGTGACIVTLSQAKGVGASFAFANGGSCGSASECGSGSCVDGVCCNDACGGGAADCQACNIAGLEGTCSPIPAGTECRAKDGACDAAEYCDGSSAACPDDGVMAASTTCRASAGVCDVAELCDGSSKSCGTDMFLGSKTSCGAASCSGGVETHAAVCSGSSASCPEPVTTSCGAYVCGESACLTGCELDAQCGAGFFCSEGACVSKMANGEACSGDSGCTSGTCADGVCCDTACEGQCEACAVPGSVGTCTAVIGQPQGEREACATDGSSCGGACDGEVRTACSYPSKTVACRDADCENGNATLAATCNGSGSCPTAERQSCGLFVCGEEACLGNCAAHSDCAENNFCNAGVCVAERNLGETCSFDAACASGSCVDGVCCNVACDGQCEACDVEGSEGTCTAVKGTPRGARPACATDGSMCGGTCDGIETDSCSYPSVSEVCREPSCDGGIAVVEATCDGAGSCPTVQMVECAPFICGERACNGDCMVKGQCESGHYCGAGVCIPELENGSACASDDQCGSGNCVDGTCCNSACNGQCEACDVEGSEGTCSPVSGAPHGARAACDTDGSVCGGTCDGTKADSCSYPDQVVCRDPSCTDGSAILEAVCDGQGACPGIEMQSCGAFVCGATACLGDCSADTDCSAGKFCSAGVCVELREQGGACGGTNECASGFCVDGTCCDVACDGQCEACDVFGSEGTCSPSTGAPRGGRPACDGQGTCAGSCDGQKTDACSYPDATVLCGDASCGDGVEHPAAACDGAGTCETGRDVACILGCDADGIACASKEPGTGSGGGAGGGEEPGAGGRGAGGEGIGGGADVDDIDGEGSSDACSCSTPGSQSGSRSGLALAGLLMLLARRTRRRAA